MRFYSAAIMAASILLPLQSLALEAISDDEDALLDFSNGASPSIGAHQQDPARHKSIQRPRRFGATNHISLGASTATNRKQDGYSVTNIASTYLSTSIRVFEYFSVFGSKSNGGSQIEYEQLFVSGPFLSNEYYTADATREVDSRGTSAGLRVDFLGTAASTPYVSVSRIRTELSSEITVIAKRYNYPRYSNNIPLETVTTVGDGGDLRDYLTRWSIGYEGMLGSNISVSGAFSHAFNDDIHARSFGVALNVWLSRHLALGVGLSRNHDTENNGGGFDLSLAL